MVKLDECVEKGDCDQDPAKIRIGKVRAEGDAKEDVFEDAGNDKEDVELQAVCQTRAR